MERARRHNARHKPHPLQQGLPQSLPQRAAPTDARVIVWSSCAHKARQWEHRLSRLGGHSVKVAPDPHALGRMTEESSPPAQPLVLLAFEQPPPHVLAAGPDVLPEEIWLLLRSLPVVAAVPSLTWEEAGLWLLCGARAFVLEGSSDEQVRAGLEAARRGCPSQLHSQVQEAVNRASAPSNCRTPKQVALTPREREVLPLLCLGLSNTEIAGRMFVTPDDVRHHLKNLYRKLGTRNRIRVLTLALSHNWVVLQDLIDHLA